MTATTCRMGGQALLGHHSWRHLALTPNGVAQVGPRCPGPWWLLAPAPPLDRGWNSAVPSVGLGRFPELPGQAACLEDLS